MVKKLSYEAFKFIPNAHNRNLIGRPRKRNNYTTMWFLECYAGILARLQWRGRLARQIAPERIVVGIGLGSCPRDHTSVPPGQIITTITTSSHVVSLLYIFTSWLVTIKPCTQSWRAFVGQDRDPSRWMLVYARTWVRSPKQWNIPGQIWIFKHPRWGWLSCR